MEKFSPTDYGNDQKAVEQIIAVKVMAKIGECGGPIQAVVKLISEVAERDLKIEELSARVKSLEASEL